MNNDQAGDDYNLCSNYSSPAQHCNVGLSLKARQNGAESLKRIFDQIVQSNNYNYNPNSNYNSDCAINQKAPTSQRQLTIFYKGVVHVFHDVNFDKAQAIMLLASGLNGSEAKSVDENPRFQSNCIQTTNYGTAKQLAPAIVNNWTMFNDNYKSGPSTSNCSTAASDDSNKLVNRRSNEQANSTAISRPTAPIVHRSHAELPYARKASLARFFAKRKDRTELCNDGNVEANTSKLRTNIDPADNYDYETSNHPQKRICS